MDSFLGTHRSIPAIIKNPAEEPTSAEIITIVRFHLGLWVRTAFRRVDLNERLYGPIPDSEPVLRVLRQEVISSALVQAVMPGAVGIHKISVLSENKLLEYPPKLRVLRRLQDHYSRVNSNPDKTSDFLPHVLDGENIEFVSEISQIPAIRGK